MSDITWTPDGETLFGKLIQAVPEPMREGIKPKLLAMLAGKAAGKPVTADTVKKMVQDDLPEPQRSALMAAIGLETPAAPPAGDGPSLVWSGKSETMFEVMLGEVPEAMRDVFRGKLLGVIAQKCPGGTVAEEHVTAVVNEIVPDPFKSSILKKFKELGDYDPQVIDDIVGRHGGSPDSLMFILHDAQDAIGFLPREALIAISNKTGISISTVYSVATFYKAFKLERPGRHHVKICCGTACHLNDRDGIAAAIEQTIGAGTDITMEKTLCLGCCDCSPVIDVDGTVFSGAAAKAKIDSII